MAQPATGVGIDGAYALARYRHALAQTNGLIDHAADHPKSPAALRARADMRLARLRTLLSTLGDPHLAYRVVHIAGTSGKGSTAVATASLLSAHGIHAGLHTSPYLQVATEKLQIAGRLIDAGTFADTVDEVIAVASRTGIGPITYGEAWFALTALTLARARVEIAVIEVGAGGRFDLTNVVTPSVSVITSVGLDHTETLGSTIPEIAWHKAGIIKPGVPVICAVTDPLALPVILDEADLAGSRFVPVVNGETFEAKRGSDGHYSWWESRRPEAVYAAAMPGRFQATNAATAVAAVRALGIELADETIRRGLLDAKLQGRLEEVERNPPVILDGAHNPEKAAALARHLRARKSATPGCRIIAVVGMLEAKDRRGVIGEIVKVTDKLVATSPRVIAKPGANAATLAADARGLGFTGNVTAIDDPMSALELAIERAGPEDLVVVTGSLYLVGNVRGRWYPDNEIVVQRTPWPDRVLVSSASRD